MTTKISQWQRIALLAAGLSASVVPMAWSQELYQMHPTDRSGSIPGHLARGKYVPVGWSSITTRISR